MIIDLLSLELFLERLSIFCTDLDSMRRGIGASRSIVRFLLDHTRDRVHPFSSLRFVSSLYEQRTLARSLVLVDVIDLLDQEQIVRAGNKLLHSRSSVHNDHSGSYVRHGTYDIQNPALVQLQLVSFPFTRTALVLDTSFLYGSIVFECELGVL